MAKVSRRLGRLGVDWVDPAGKRRWKTFADETDARVFLGRVLVESGHPLSVDPSITVTEYAPRWLAIAAVKIRPTSLARYKRIITKQIMPALGLQAVSRLTQASVRDWIAGLMTRETKPLARATAMQVLDVMSQILDQAKDDGIVTENVCKGLSKKLRLTSNAIGRNIQAMTPEQLGRFLRMAEERSPEWRLGFRIMALTGMRLGEFLGLQWADVDHSRKIIRVERQLREDGAVCPPKSKRSSRDIDAPTGLLQALGNEQTRQGGVWVASAKWGDEPGELEAWSTRNSIRYTMKGILKAAGLPPHFTPHCFRHTFASIHLSQGQPVVWVQQQLGHEQIGTTVDLYGKWLKHEGHSAADSLERLLNIP